ncbi:MAG: PLP-dependent aminotransferase family protein [Hyphomonadaceae bacterium]
MPGITRNAAARRAPPDWLARLAAAPQSPLYLALADALGAAVEAGELRPGDRLPAQRAVAAALGADLSTVTRGFAQARARGLLAGEAGRGTFVRAVQGPAVDHSMNLPPPIGASMRDALSEGMAAVLRRADPATLMTYRTGPSPRERTAAAGWLAPALGPIATERLFLAPGAQSAITALLALLAQPGGALLVEPLAYPGLLAAARAQKLALIPIVCDAEGFLPDAFESACRAHAPALAYCTPTLQNPTGATASLARRKALVAAARKHDATIIEDDAYGPLDPEAAPLAALAPERVYHIATLSKALAPGLRTAFLTAPIGADFAAVAGALRATSLTTAPLLAELAVEWIESGLARHICAVIRRESAARMKLAKAALPQALGGPHGFHLWLDLPVGWTPHAFAAAAVGSSVAVTPGKHFLADPNQEMRGVRLGLGAAPDRQQLAQGLAALARFL